MTRKVILSVTNFYYYYVFTCSLPISYYKKLFIGIPQSSFMMSDAFSAIMTTAACVCAAGIRGMMEASATRSPATPLT